MADDRNHNELPNDAATKDPLGLSALPPLDPPEGLWTQIEDALDARGRNSRPKRTWVPLAMAATVALMALTIGLLRGMYGPVPATDTTPTQLVRLQAVSAALEDQLDDYRYGVVSATTADAVARLEMELAWLDAEISESPDDPALWAERVALLGEMNQRYIQSDWRSEMMLASY